jgi:two-component system, sensor histidine kinase and response regulator
MMVHNEEASSLDIGRALSRMGNDESLLREIGALFLEECPPALLALRTAVAARDSRAIERGAHSLKGSIATFGNGPAFQAAFELEKQGRSGDLAMVESNLQRIEYSVARLCVELQALVSG